MPSLFSKDSGISYACSASMDGVSGPSWGSSSESFVQQSSMSGCLSLKMAVPRQQFANAKQLSFLFQDQESSSTQSTGQSCSKEACVKDGNPTGQSIISAPPGDYMNSKCSLFLELRKQKEEELRKQKEEELLTAKGALEKARIQLRQQCYSSVQQSGSLWVASQEAEKATLFAMRKMLYFAEGCIR